MIVKSEFDERLCCSHQWVVVAIAASAKRDGEACTFERCGADGCKATCYRSVKTRLIIEYDLGVKWEAEPGGGERKPRRRDDAMRASASKAAVAWGFDGAS